MTLNQYGLIFNISVTIIIAFCGLPNSYYSHDGGKYLTMYSGSPRGKRYNKIKKAIAWIGILLIIAGFVLQFADSLKN